MAANRRGWFTVADWRGERREERNPLSVAGNRPVAFCYDFCYGKALYLQKQPEKTVAKSMSYSNIKKFRKMSRYAE